LARPENGGFGGQDDGRPGGEGESMSDLWTIVHSDTKKPVLPMDCNPESDDEGMLVYRSQKAAELAAEYQAEMYDIVCEARRLDEAQP
jgi:hypothetical protein